VTEDAPIWLRKTPTSHPSYQRGSQKGVFDDASILLPAGVPEAAVQKVWTENYIPRLKLARRVQGNPRFRTVLLDTHTTPALGNSKPDMIGYAKEPYQVFNIHLIGENKPRRELLEGTFTNQEKGQLIGYLKELLALMPHRPLAIGFLTDGFLIQFFKLHAGTTSAPMKLIETRTVKLEGKLLVLFFFFFFLLFYSFTLAEGGIWLAAALTAEPDELGVINPEFEKPADVSKLLGVGATSSVFAARYDGMLSFIFCCFYLTFVGKSGVLKVFHRSHQHRAQTEMVILEALSGLKPQVPSVLAASTSGLILSPKEHRSWLFLEEMPCHPEQPTSQP